MKKVLIVCLGIGIVLILAGVVLNFTTGLKKTTCVLELNQKPYDMLITNYTIYSKDDMVTKVVEKHIVGSSDLKRLQEVDENIKNRCKKMNERYSGYSYKSTIKNDKLVGTIEIDYTKFNMKKYVNDISSAKDYVNEKNQYTLEGAKKYYKYTKAICND